LGGLLLVFWLAGLFSVLQWWNVMRQPDWRMLLAGSSVLLTGLAARTTWDNLPGGQLAWDGDVWRWESAGYQTGVGEHALSVIADFQQRLLLRLENPDGASLWLWVEQNAMPERWLDFRRAVYSLRKSRASLPAHDFVPVDSSDSPPPAVALSKAMLSQHVPQAKP
jgi:hypothetical protein